MNHPALRHVRNTLIAALGLTGCIERAASVPEGQPADAALPDIRVPDPDPLHCPGGEPIRTADGRETGYVRCADGSVDRVGPATCEPIINWRSCERGDGERDTCAVDADCNDAPGGRCVEPGGFFLPDCSCKYPCQTDADCGPDAVCLCDALAPGDTIGSRCVPTPCRGVDDCGGARCGVGEFSDGCGLSQQLACRGVDDTCASDAHCRGRESGGGNCWPPDAYGSRVVDEPALNEIWHCDSPGSICGRPLRVDAQPRLSPADHRADWQAAAPRVGLDAGLAAHWRAIAALEHASVASFARFSLQLLALGAPADLLADCQRAAADEVEHARMAYAIASAFAGEAVGPGPLSLDGITLDVDPAAVLREVIVEGCIGETLGAVEAAEAARTVEDPTIAAACARIAEDELRHAALGWRTARWLLAYHPELAPMASEAFADGIRHHTGGIESSPDTIARNGIVARPDLRRAAWREVIAPLARRLLSSGPAHGAPPGGAA